MLAEARNAELETARARLEHNALHDALTGLPNRRYLDEMLASHAAGCARHGGGVGLLHIDLDQFKQINDTLGHVAGDAMLVHAARLLKASIRSEDFVARVGGDEFIVICRLQNDTTELMPLAERIIELICQPVRYETHLCRFGACVGIAVESGCQVSPQRLLVNSDIALYRAKARGRNRAEYFSAELQAQIVNTKRLADDILRGLEQREFLAHYQPQFDARSFEVVGVEALVRWNHPTQGLRTPNQFLKVAEDLNAVGALDQMILEQTLADLERWHDMGLPLTKVSVNVSSKRLNDRELIDSLRKLSFRPGTLSFELVESIFFDETDQVVASNIEQIRALGIDIEIDDFGTGHASIVSLLKLSPSRLKIDRQFVTHVMESPEQARLVASIIEIGKSLGIGVIAEGVETIDQAMLLRELGCDALQGYAFARPMTAAELEAFMFARTPNHERTRPIAAAATRFGPFYERPASLAG
jgi:diguanylate cyclase (GGDEF)-like protein